MQVRPAAWGSYLCRESKFIEFKNMHDTFCVKLGQVNHSYLDDCYGKGRGSGQPWAAASYKYLNTCYLAGDRRAWVQEGGGAWGWGQAEMTQCCHNCYLAGGIFLDGGGRGGGLFLSMSSNRNNPHTVQNSSKQRVGTEFSNKFLPNVKELLWTKRSTACCDIRRATISVLPS